MTSGLPRVLQMVRVSWSRNAVACFLICAVWGGSLIGRQCHGEERPWQAMTHDGLRISGHVRGNRPEELQFEESNGVNKGRLWSLKQLERIELSSRHRFTTEIGIRQLRLVNGDVLHASLKPHRDAALFPRRQDLIVTGPFDGQMELPWNGLDAISQTPGFRCLVENDFESDFPNWSTDRPETPPRCDQQHAQSGRNSLKCSAEQPILKYTLPHQVPAGSIQFCFYLDSDAPSAGESLVRIHFEAGREAANPNGVLNPDVKTANSQKTVSEASLEVFLSGTSRTFEARSSVGIHVGAQSLTRKMGWHLLTVQFSPQSLVVAIDGDLLMSRRLAGASSFVPKSVEFTAEGKSSPLWIDDFIVLSAARQSRFARMQYVQDEVVQTNGDQLFGTIQELGASEVRLAAGKREATVAWSGITSVRLAEGPIESRPVSGWICRIDLQPLWTATDWRESDSLQGAVTAWTDQQVRLEHSILGTLNIPIKSIRQIKPGYRGVELGLEGRVIHLGDEVKSHFHRPTPKGTLWSQTFRLTAVPDGVARLRLIAHDIEPSGMMAKKSPIVERLRKGEFITEVRLNQKLVGILNEHVSGVGSKELPQVVVLNLAKGEIQVGDNTLELRLHPSREEVPEYDDWELLGLSLEMEQK